MYNLEVLRIIAGCDYVRNNVYGPLVSATASGITFNAVWQVDGRDSSAQMLTITEEDYAVALADYNLKNN